MTRQSDPADPSGLGERDDPAEVAGGFPRHLTGALLEQGRRRRRAREAAQTAVLTAALALLALGLPTERPLGRGLELVDALARGELPWARRPWGALVLLVRDATGTSIERAAFLLAALCFALCLPALLSIARRFEFGRGRSLVVALVVLASPVCWTMGTSSGPAALGALAACALFRALLGPAHAAAAPRARTLDVAATWVVASWASPPLLWTWPALLLRPAGARRRAPSIAVAVAALVVAFALCAGWRALLDDPVDALRAALGGGGGGPGPLVLWCVAWIPALGLAALGPAALFLLRRGPEEAPPPRWLLMWCLGPLAAQALGGSVAWALPFGWLVPAALLGGLDLVSRAGEERLPRALALALVAQLALALAAGGAVRASDPTAAWRALACRELAPGDLVWTAEPTHRRLVERRYGLDAVALDELAPLGAGARAARWSALVDAAERHERAGGRVVLDDAGPGAMGALLAEARERLAARVELVELGRVRTEPGSD